MPTDLYIKGHPEVATTLRSPWRDVLNALNTSAAQGKEFTDDETIEGDFAIFRLPDVALLVSKDIEDDDISQAFKI